MNREFRRKKDLLWLLTRKEITLKYKRTVLGILWSLLNPLLFAIVLVIAFKIFMRIQMENYTFFLLLCPFPLELVLCFRHHVYGNSYRECNPHKKNPFPETFSRSIYHPGSACQSYLCPTHHHWFFIFLWKGAWDELGPYNPYPYRHTIFCNDRNLSVDFLGEYLF